VESHGEKPESDSRDDGVSGLNHHKGLRLFGNSSGVSHKSASAILQVAIASGASQKLIPAASLKSSCTTNASCSFNVISALRVVCLQEFHVRLTRCAKHGLKRTTTKATSSYVGASTSRTYELNSNVARAILRGRTIVVECANRSALNIIGIDLSYGIGRDIHEAEYRLKISRGTKLSAKLEERYDVGSCDASS
jgi:hypothetical protein